jgi:hypothetical protein
LRFREPFQLLFIDIDDPVFFDSSDGVAELLSASVAGECALGDFYYE